MSNKLLPKTHCFLLLLFVLIGLTLGCLQSSAGAQVLRWNIEATVIDVFDPEMIFPDVRLGDPVSGFISYDLATEPDSSDPHHVFYFHPASFQNVGIVIENPRNGTEIKFVPDPCDCAGPEISNDREDEVAGLFDGVSVLQFVMPPAGSTGTSPVVSVDLFGPPSILSDTSLPATLDLDDWPDATVLFLDLLGVEDVSSYVVAEIHTLTPVTPQIIPGDFNADGTVDAADYVVWRNSLGTVYTHDHYVDWRTNFGKLAVGVGLAASESSAVPEPSSVSMLLIVTLGRLYLAKNRC